MVLKTFTEFVLLLFTNSMVLGIINNTNTDRLVLSPAELASLVLKLGGRDIETERQQCNKTFTFQTSTELTTGTYTYL